MRNLIMCSTILLAVLLTGSAFAADWTTPELVTAGINTQYADWTPYLSYDGLSLYYSRYNTDTFYNSRIFEARRDQPSGAFTSTREVLRSSSHVLSPWVSPDNLRMYYHEESSSWQIKMSQRASVNDSWSQGTAINLGSVINPGFSALSSNELTMVFDSHASGSSDWNLFIATRPDRNSSFNNVRILTELNTASNEASPALSPDALTIYFQHEGNIFQATRSSLNDPFGNAVHMTAFDIAGGYSIHPAISSDGKAFYFTGDLAGQPGDIYVSYVVPEPATIMLLGLGSLALRRRWFLN